MNTHAGFTPFITLMMLLALFATHFFCERQESYSISADLTAAMAAHHSPLEEHAD